jgi:hypothetical protein
MARVTYLEIVEMLSGTLKGRDKERLIHIVVRKKALKEEDEDLNIVLDGLLREIQGEENNVK